MGGAIEVRSLLNMGTGVTVDLPLEILPALPAATEVIKAVETDHPQLRVLVVDDHVANRSLLTQQLAFLGQHVRSAEDGAQGLLSWEEEKVDVIVTDCNMPVMNGYDMARAIRRREQELGLAPCMIIGFTANAQPEERAKCLAAGMDDCLFKPVSLSTLSTLLQTIGRTSRVVPASPGGDVTVNSMTSALHELTGGDVAMTRSLVFEAHRSFVLDLTELRKLMQDFSPRAMGNLVHRINGGVRLLQLKHLMDACERVEMLCAAPEVDSESVLEVALFIVDELEPVLCGLEAMQDQMRVASTSGVQVA